VHVGIIELAYNLWFAHVYGNSVWDTIRENVECYCLRSYGRRKAKKQF